MHAEVERRVVSGVVYNDDGYPTPIVHQWDRLVHRVRRVAGRDVTFIMSFAALAGLDRD